MGEVRTSLRNQALHLRSYQENLVTPMTVQTKEMIELANNLENSLKFNSSSFNEALKNFKDEIREAQRFINEEGTPFVQQAARELITNFKGEINSYLNLVVERTKKDLGRCEPMSVVYKSLVVAGCNRVIDPFVS